MGDIYEFNNFNAGAGYISPPVAGSLNLADPPPKIDKIISGLGKIATRAENFFHTSIHPEFFVEKLKEILPEKPKNLDSDNSQRSQQVYQVVHRSNEIIASARTIWPFTLFRDDIVVDRTKVSITKRDFFFVSEVMSIRLEDILNVKVSLGPFFGSLTLAVRILSSEDHHTINFFSRSDAIRLKHIIQGYIIAIHDNIDCKYQDKEELINTLNELGQENC